MAKEYCPWCDKEQEIIQTVPWQSNACSVCNQELDEEAAAKVQ